ncbi:MAG: isoprenylcysteine carboxylmethyltransferase family protein [Spirochaetales bacterium]|nr:isoprenylcysteine carboxylmethyltransferase family protein [Spirochaetales bacterium]
MAKLFKNDRGQIWVLGQFVWGGLLLLAGPLSSLGSFWPALVVTIVGGGLSIAAVLNLGNNLSVFPKPKDDAVFVDRGLYRWVRHPIYSGLLVAGIGWCIFWLSWPACILEVIFVLWMDRKAASEERWLNQRYSNYAAYQKRVKKFFPGLY